MRSNRAFTSWRGWSFYLSSRYPPSRHPWQVAVGITITLTLVILGMFAPWLTPHPATETQLTARLLAPSWQPQPDGTRYLLGTDLLGRDILSRLIAGARTSLLVSLLSVSLSGCIGVSLGLIAGFKRRSRLLLDRLADIWQAVPYLIVALAAAAVLGGSLANVVIVLAITTWTLFYRVVRAEVMRLRNQDFVAAGRALGASEQRILWVYILPHVIPLIIPVATLLTANIIIFEASLSFLGLGIPPPAVSWGSMAADGRGYEVLAWWVPLFPGLAIFVAVLGINLLGDSLRDWLDPFARNG
ncbi:MAG: ABC transporter permease [Deinococcota bacterium]